MIKILFGKIYFILFFTNVNCSFKDSPQNNYHKFNHEISNIENQAPVNIPHRLKFLKYSSSQIVDVDDKKYHCVFLQDGDIYCELIGGSSENKRGSLRGLIGKRGSMRDGALDKRGSLRGLLGKRGSRRGLLGKRGSRRGLLGKRGSLRSLIGKRGSRRGLLGKRGSRRGLLGKRGSRRGLLGKRGTLRGVLGKRRYIRPEIQRQVYNCHFLGKCGLLYDSGEETDISLRDSSEHQET